MPITEKSFRLLIVLAATLVFVVPAVAAENATNGGPSLGKWEFAGKDNTGLTWSGTLSVEKLDPARFDAKKFHSLCSLEVESADPAKGTKVVEAPCEWESGKRTFSFGNTWPATNVYTAILSEDGKVLTQGKWTESKFERGKIVGVVRTGEWTARLPKR